MLILGDCQRWGCEVWMAVRVSGVRRDKEVMRSGYTLTPKGVGPHKYPQVGPVLATFIVHGMTMCMS